MKTVISGVVSLFFLTSMPAMAQGRGHGGGGDDDGLHEFKTLLRAANLTSDQQGQVQTLMRASWTQNQQLHTQMRALHQQIVDRLASTASVSASDIAPLQQQIAQLRAQIDQQNIQTAIRIRGVLSADQLRQVSAANDQIKSLHEQMRTVLPPPSSVQGPTGPAMAPGQFQAPVP
jgi:hypothetical protein